MKGAGPRGAPFCKPSTTPLAEEHGLCVGRTAHVSFLSTKSFGAMVTLVRPASKRAGRRALLGPSRTLSAAANDSVALSLNHRRGAGRSPFRRRGGRSATFFPQRLPRPPRLLFLSRFTVLLLLLLLAAASGRATGSSADGPGRGKETVVGALKEVSVDAVGADATGRGGMSTSESSRSGASLDNAAVGLSLSAGGDTWPAAAAAKEIGRPAAARVKGRWG